MGLQSETSKLGLISPIVLDESSLQRSKALKVMGGVSILIAVLFFIDLLVFAGLCFGYRDSISKCQTEVLVAMLVLGVIQSILGLLSANKLLTLKAEHSQEGYKLLMKSLMVVNSILSLLSASHAVTAVVIFLVDVSPNSQEEVSAFGSVYIATLSLVILSTVHFFHSIISMLIAACYTPSRQSSYIADAAVLADAAQP